MGANEPCVLPRKKCVLLNVFGQNVRRKTITKKMESILVVLNVDLQLEFSF